MMITLQDILVIAIAFGVMGLILGLVLSDRPRFKAPKLPTTPEQIEMWNKICDHMESIKKGKS